MSELSKTNLLLQIKSLPTQEQYVSIIMFKYFRAGLAKICCSNHPLLLEAGRHKNIPRNERICVFCQDNAVESEEHFIMYCSLYAD